MSVRVPSYIAKSQHVLRNVFKSRNCKCPVVERELTVKNRMCHIWSGKNEAKEPMICCFIMPNSKGQCKLIMDLLKAISAKILARNVRHVVFVCNEEKTRVNYQAIDFLNRTFQRFEVLSYGETQYNILDNVLVPRYEKLSSEEAKEMIVHRDHELSRLVERDPVCRVMGLRIDDVVRAFVPCAISGEYTILKRVIPDH